ncbi:S1C family serine protease, partial [Meiothermus luteus]|uniref:S1C family serine protease n=1 Tax=Meiothermus luteus TaxID=2026184 RepID=UPI0015FD671C
MALAQTLPRDVRERIIAATVLITTGNNDVGSGTLISPQGFILTNYHVIGDLEKRRIAPRLFVGTTRFVDQPPEIRYLADVVATDPNLDLAILRITRTADGQPIGNVTFPAVPIGDSNKLIVGDPIYVFGFKATGGYTITMSTGVVGGFTGEDMESGGKQWIKHDAQIGPGNSGGGAFNGDGELVGINTLLSVSRDGNSRTAFMRPSALAWGLIGPNVTGLVNRAPTAS